MKVFASANGEPFRKTKKNKAEVCQKQGSSKTLNGSKQKDMNKTARPPTDGCWLFC